MHAVGVTPDDLDKPQVRTASHFIARRTRRLDQRSRRSVSRLCGGKVRAHLERLLRGALTLRDLRKATRATTTL